MKKLLAIGLACICTLTFIGCNSNSNNTGNTTDNNGENAAQTTNTAENNGDDIYIEMVGNSFAVQFCNINVDGARAAAEELGNVTLNYNASQDSSQIQEQIDILNQAIAQKPDAILIAAADPDALEAQMLKAKEEGIPVIAYDIPFNDAPEGSLYATVATNNEEAAGLAAEEMVKESSFIEKIKHATSSDPVVVSALAPDAVMTAHKQRIEGFANRLYDLLQEYQPGAVEITGHTSFEKASESDAAVIIRAEIPPTKAETDIRNQAQTMISDDRVIGVFCVNEAAASALLSATSDGTDLDRENGKYKDILAIGFDAGSTMKNAVASQYFYGAVAQDPFAMGYEGLKLCIDVYNGNSVEDKDAPAVWYNHENMEEEDIAKILYD